VAVIAVKFLDLAGQTMESTPSIAVATLIIPIFDTARVFAIRILNGRSPFSPDKNHIHHILKNAGLSQLAIVGTLAAVNFVFIAFASYFDYLGDTVLIGIMGGIIILTGVGLELYNPSKLGEKTPVTNPLAEESVASPI
jgi:hypothetical protein